MGVAHFDIVAEDVVSWILLSGCPLALPRAAMMRARTFAGDAGRAQVVQPGPHAVGDDAALLNLVVERIGYISRR